LPGNPVAVMVTFYEFVQDALRVLQGRRDLARRRRSWCRFRSHQENAGRTEFQRGVLTPDGNGGFTVRTTGEQGSGILSSMAQANCFIVLPTDTGNCRRRRLGRRAVAGGC
jgi:molybdopterin molybdotransferase